MSPPVGLNTNVAAQMVNVNDRVFDHYEALVHKDVGELNKLNEKAKKLTELSSVLSRAKENGQADFTNNPEMREVIDYIFENAPAVLGHEKTYVWKDKDITPTLGAIQNEVSLCMQQGNARMHNIQMRLEERVQMVKSAKEAIESWSRLLEHINANMRKG